MEKLPGIVQELFKLKSFPLSEMFTKKLNQS
jgi:hypothetical protein